jgi:hypothetical protein
LFAAASDGGGDARAHGKNQRRTRSPLLLVTLLLHTMRQTRIPRLDRPYYNEPLGGMRQHCH